MQHEDDINCSFPYNRFTSSQDSYLAIPYNTDACHNLQCERVIQNSGVNKTFLSFLVYADRYNMETIFTTRFYYRDGLTSYEYSDCAILMHATFTECIYIYFYSMQIETTWTRFYCCFFAIVKMNLQFMNTVIVGYNTDACWIFTVWARYTIFWR